jgi:hypothetical protein
MVIVNLDAERSKAEATQKEFLDKMAPHTAHTKNCIGLDKMLGGKKVKFNGRERHLELREAALAEVQTQRLNPWVNHDELMEYVELQR